MQGPALAVQPVQPELVARPMMAPAERPPVAWALPKPAPQAARPTKALRVLRRETRQRKARRLEEMPARRRPVRQVPERRRYPTRATRRLPRRAPQARPEARPVSAAHLQVRPTKAPARPEAQARPTLARAPEARPTTGQPAQGKTVTRAGVRPARPTTAQVPSQEEVRARAIPTSGHREPRDLTEPTASPRSERALLPEPQAAVAAERQGHPSWVPAKEARPKTATQTAERRRASPKRPAPARPEPVLPRRDWGVRLWSARQPLRP